MDIQVIVIVGDRSVTEDGDVEWENVCKDQMLLTTTTDMRLDRYQQSTINEIKYSVQKCLEELIPEYLNKLTKSPEGG